jgi:ABC-2 type transport system permease protein
MPQWLQVATFVDPLKHFIIIVKSIFLKGASTGFVLENLWPLILISVVTLSAANFIFRRQIA